MSAGTPTTDDSFKSTGDDISIDDECIDCGIIDTGKLDDMSDRISGMTMGDSEDPLGSCERIEKHDGGFRQIQTHHTCTLQIESSREVTTAMNEYNAKSTHRGGVAMYEFLTGATIQSGISLVVALDKLCAVTQKLVRCGGPNFLCAEEVFSRVHDSVHAVIDMGTRYVEDTVSESDPGIPDLLMRLDSPKPWDCQDTPVEYVSTIWDWHGWHKTLEFWYAVADARDAVRTLVDAVFDECKFKCAELVRDCVHSTLCSSLVYDEQMGPSQLYDLTTTVIAGLASCDMDVVWMILHNGHASVKLIDDIDWGDRELILGHTIAYGASMDDWVAQCTILYDASSAWTTKWDETIRAWCVPGPLTSDVRDFKDTYTDLLFHVGTALDAVIELHINQCVMNCGVDIDGLYTSLVAVLVCMPGLVCRPVTSQVSPKKLIHLILPQITRAGFMRKEMERRNSPITDSPDPLEVYRRSYCGSEWSIPHVSRVTNALAVSLCEVVGFLDRVSDPNDPLVVGYDPLVTYTDTRPDVSDGLCVPGTDACVNRAMAYLVALQKVFASRDNPLCLEKDTEAGAVCSIHTALTLVIQAVPNPTDDNYNDESVGHEISRTLCALYHEIEDALLPELRLAWMSHVLAQVEEDLSCIAGVDIVDDTTHDSVEDSCCAPPESDCSRSVSIIAGCVPVQIHEGDCGSGDGYVVSDCVPPFVRFLTMVGVSGSALELGSGTGAVAVALAAVGCKVVATDVDTNTHRSIVDVDGSDGEGTVSDRFDNLLDLIKYNVNANRPCIDVTGGSVDVMRLQWSDMSDVTKLMDVHPEPFDYIIGCDVLCGQESDAFLFLTIAAAMSSMTRAFLAFADTDRNLGDITVEALACGLRANVAYTDTDIGVTVVELTPDCVDGERVAENAKY